MEERMARLEEGQKRLEARIENFETKVENAFNTLINEVRITNNTLQGIWNVADEVLRVGSKQRKVSEIMSQAYEKAVEELKA